MTDEYSRMRVRVTWTKKQEKSAALAALDFIQPDMIIGVAAAQR